MVGKVAVFGMGKFGASVATRLYAEGVDVLAVDRRLELVEQYKDDVSVAASFDATIKENLASYEIGQMDAAVVAIGTDFEAAVLISVLLKELEVPLVIAKAVTDLQKRVLKAIGVDQVVLPEEEMGRRVAEHLVRESIVDFIELPAGFSLHRIDVDREWVGKTLGELRLLSERRLNLIQVVRPRTAESPAPADENGVLEPLHIALPDGQTRLQEGDRLDVIGPDEELEKYL